MKEAVGPYRIVRPVGEGGMGVVYEAVDDRLGRRVALKTLRPAGADASARDRLRREARAAASVNHPNVCQVYDVGEEDGDLYVAMELLEGEPLSARIARGPIPPAEALRIALGVLAALEAVHAKGVLHRDLKPTNVFLTPHGPKVLDFGLAVPVASAAVRGASRLTMAGQVVGTPEYMAPERWTDEGVGAQSDLFSLGAILFEMVTGRPAFAGRTAMEVYHAIAYEQPPALAGGAGADALDRVLQRALAKAPGDRYPSATEMAQAVREALDGAGSTATPAVRAMTRILAIPFRLLRPDPEIEFLAVGLADAVSTSLSGLPSLVVRSPHAGAKYAGAAPDLKAIAAEAQVDVVLVGTLMRGGDRVRVAAQLLEVPGGTILHSETAQVPLGDVFALQDELARRIVEALAIPLAGRASGALQRDVPKSPRAYELYLRANHVSLVTDTLPRAVGLYRECLEEDPRYAPAWARLGRAYRVMGKYGVSDDPVADLDRARDAFRQALALNPDLSLAHNLFTHYEIEEMGKAREAMVRLLGRVRAAPADPDLFAGLVLACRFGGLLDASVAADRRARRLDPGMRTSVAYTYFMRAEYERAIEHEDQEMRWLVLYALPMLGREAEALEACRQVERTRPRGHQATMTRSMIAAIERRPEGVEENVRFMLATSFHDPEGFYFMARALAHAGAADLALSTLDRVVAGGFHCLGAFRRDAWLDSLRGTPEFAALLRRVEEGRRASVEAFREAGGAALLGVEE